MGILTRGLRVKPLWNVRSAFFTQKLQLPHSGAFQANMQKEVNNYVVCSFQACHFNMFESLSCRFGFL